MKNNGDSSKTINPKISISIQNLTVWTPEETSWWRKKVTKQKNVILNNVSGYIEQGEFAAVIGPSGAGKTTFLSSLAGRSRLPRAGSVVITGANGVVKPDANGGSVELLPQFEAFLESLSVKEHLLFMIEMKRGSSKEDHNQRLLESLLSELMLKALEHSSIGSLSGGERRLLALATSLLSNPQILICDEPTTGLDSHNAFLVVSALKRLSETGRIVVCSVHQPSCQLFHEFSSILLMANGELLFHGDQDQCEQVFDSINLHCPLNYNPAEFYVRAISDQTDTNEKIVENYQRRLAESFTHRETCSSNRGPTQLAQRNWFKQVQLILWRLSLTLKRDVKTHLIQLFLSVIMSALVLGTCYVGISGATQRGVQDIRGFLWLITSEVCFSLSYNALYVFENEMPLFRREVGIYKCSAYFVARFLSFLPRCVVWPAVLVAVSSLAVQLPQHALTAAQVALALTVAGVAALAYGLAMAAVFTSSGLLGEVMPCADLPLFLVSGVFLRLGALPAALRPLQYISHFYYAMDAVSNIYWRQIGPIDCPWNASSVCVKDGAAVLAESGYSEDWLLQDGLGLLGAGLLWGVLGYCGLRNEERKGYTY